MTRLPFLFLPSRHRIRGVRPGRQAAGDLRRRPLRQAAVDVRGRRPAGRRLWIRGCRDRRAPQGQGKRQRHTLLLPVLPLLMRPGTPRPSAPSCRACCLRCSTRWMTWCCAWMGAFGPRHASWPSRCGARVGGLTSSSRTRKSSEPGPASSPRRLFRPLRRNPTPLLLGLLLQVGVQAYG